MDIGGSKTDAVITDASNKVIIRGAYGGFNIRTAELPVFIESIKNIIDDLLNRKELSKEEVEFVSLAAAGAGDDEQRSEWEEKLMGSIPGLKFHIITDAEAALAGAFNGNPGIIVIAGTGSIAWGKDHDGKTARMGGYGYLLGDEGSGYWIGKKALKTALNHHYKGENSALGTEIMIRWDLTELPLAINKIYSASHPAAETASIARIVFDLDNAGEMESRKIVNKAGKKLGKLAAGCADILNCKPPVPVCLLGGIGARILLFPKYFKHELSKFGGGLAEPLYEPAVGAVIAVSEGKKFTTNKANNIHW